MAKKKMNKKTKIILSGAAVLAAGVLNWFTIFYKKL